MGPLFLFLHLGPATGFANTLSGEVKGGTSSNVNLESDSNSVDHSIYLRASYRDQFGVSADYTNFFRYSDNDSVGAELSHELNLASKDSLFLALSFKDYLNQAVGTTDTRFSFIDLSAILTSNPVDPTLSLRKYLSDASRTDLAGSITLRKDTEPNENQNLVLKFTPELLLSNDRDFSKLSAELNAQFDHDLSDASTLFLSALVLPSFYLSREADGVSPLLKRRGATTLNRRASTKEATLYLEFKTGIDYELSKQVTLELTAFASKQVSRSTTFNFNELGGSLGLKL